MKRFVQGLGAGIIMTTLIFTVAYYTVGNNKMTDKEIIKEAQKLGMEKVTEPPLFTEPNTDGGVSDGAVQNEAAPQEQVIVPADGETGTEQSVPQDEGIVEEQVAPQSEDVSQEQEIPQSDGVPTGENNIQDNITQQDPATQPEPADVVVQLTVDKGDEAITVANKLQQLGVISDAVEFDRYLRSNSQTRTIQVGTYEVRQGMSYEELASMLVQR